MKFNTAVSELMTYTNELNSMEKIPEKMLQILCLLLYPFAPHIACEIWEEKIDSDSILPEVKWPEYDEKLTVDKTVTIAIQVQGKLRATTEVPAGTDKDTVMKIALEISNVGKYTKDKEIKKVIYVSDKLLNIVVGK